MKTRVAPTRAELLRSKRLLAQVGRGAQLLRHKREALVRAIVPLARPAAEARRAIADTAIAAYRAEHAALAVHGEAAVAASAWPPRTLEVDLETTRVWGVTIPSIAAPPTFARDLEARATAPSSTSPAVFEAANQFETLATQLLLAVVRESQVRALGSALARTVRQLNTLEQRVMPALVTRAGIIAGALEEHDREDQTRLRTLRGRRR